MELMEAIRTRRSVRDYLPDPVTDEQLAAVLEAAQLAPTACNNQPFRIIVVKDDELRQKLVPACKGQKFVGQAPVVVFGNLRWIIGYTASTSGRPGTCRFSPLVPGRFSTCPTADHTSSNSSPFE